MIKLVLDRSVFEYDGRGIAQVTRALYKKLLHLYGNEIKLFCLCHKPLVLDLDFPYEEIRVPGSWDEAWGYQFADAVANLRPDFVHFPFNGNYSRRWGDVIPKTTKIISTIHDMIPFVLPEMHHVSREWLAQKKEDIQFFCDTSSVVFTDSDSAKSDIERFINVNDSKVKVLYYSGFLKNEAPENPEIVNYFLYNGGYDYRKGLPEIVDNFLQLKMAGRLTSKLVLTGKVQPLSPRFSALTRYGIEQGWIVDMGYVSDAELAGLFSCATAAIYLSAYEGFGLPPLEAMSLGCPVITCRNSSLIEVCGDAVCYVDRNSEQDIQKALLKLENDLDYRNVLIAAGKAQSEKFSWDKTTEQFFETLKQLKD